MIIEQLPIDFEAARQARDVGIQRAVEHADRVEPQWSEQAYALALEYAQRHPSFTTEQIREYALARGLPPPPDGRAWGGVLARLAKTGRIQKVGYTPSANRKAHLRPVVVWRVAA